MAGPTLTHPPTAGEGPQPLPVPDTVSDREPGPRVRHADPVDRVAMTDPADDPEYLATWFAYYLAALLLGLLSLGGLWIYLAL